MIRNLDGDVVVFQQGFGPVPLDARNAVDRAAQFECHA